MVLRSVVLIGDWFSRQPSRRLKHSIPTPDKYEMSQKNFTLLKLEFSNDGHKQNAKKKNY